MKISASAHCHKWMCFEGWIISSSSSTHICLVRIHCHVCLLVCVCVCVWVKYMQHLSSFKVVFQSVRFWCVYFPLFFPFALFFFLSNSLVMHELITCHVPMVIIMMITNIVCVRMIFVKANKCIETRTQLWMTNSTTETTKQAPTTPTVLLVVCMLRYCILKMQCLSLSACASLQLCYCSIHFGHITLFLFLIFVNVSAGALLHFVFVIANWFSVCFHHIFFSHSLWTIVYWMRQMEKWYEFLFCESLTVVVAQSVQHFFFIFLRKKETSYN